MKRLGLAAFLSVLFLLSTTVLVFAANTFWDVPNTAWYTPAVESLSEKNIIQGNPDGSYAPDDYVNRAELAVIIDRTIQYLEEGEVEVSKMPSEILLNVPFSAQAPTGDWSLPYAEACEETLLIMVKYFLAGEELTQEKADSEILSLASFVEENGMGVDISVAQAGAVAEAYYGLSATVYSGDEVSTESIKALLAEGHPVIIPVAGQLLNNPNFTGDGPPYHMIVLIGYNKEGFIAHDPGTSQGANYVYSYDTIDNALHDWTGSKSTVEEGDRVILVLND